MRPVHIHFIISLSALLFCVSCVSTKQYKAAQLEAQKNDSLYVWSMRTLKASQDANAALANQKAALQKEANELNLLLTAAKEDNTQMRSQLKALSALSSAQAESIKKSLDNIGAKDSYIMDLHYALARRDSINLAVMLELKATLGNIGSEDLSIKIEKGIIYADFSDKILFNSDSNSYTLNDKAKSVLGRFARVLRDQPDIEIMVEGHTDSIAYPQTPLLDNWDLSVKRATTLVRILQNDYDISPLRMTAAGRSEFIAIAPDDTPEGRAANRRTRIVILPQLDPLLQLLERKPGQRETAQAISGS